MPTPIESEESLRACYPAVVERARLKTMPKLDAHCRQFISLSPFLCLGTSTEAGADVTPRGDAPGFVRVLDDSTIAIPDWPGNNRLDSLGNIMANPQVGLLFLVPGFEETLRLNGTAEITMDPALLESWTVNGKHPRSVMVVTIREVYFHCGKALIRSKLWAEESRVPRTAMPSYGQILKDEIEAVETAAQIDQSIAESYKNKLY